MEIRTQLKPLLGSNATFKGKLTKFGIRKRFEGFDEITMLFNDVYINDIYVDHMWIADCKRLRAQNLHINSTIQFKCIIDSYYKGSVDYSVKNKRLVTVLKKGKGKTLLQFASSKRILDTVNPVYKERIQKHNEMLFVNA